MYQARDLHHNNNNLDIRNDRSSGSKALVPDIYSQKPQSFDVNKYNLEDKNLKPEVAKLILLIYINNSIAGFLLML